MIWQQNFQKLKKSMYWMFIRSSTIIVDYCSNVQSMITESVVRLNMDQPSKMQYAELRRNRKSKDEGLKVKNLLLINYKYNNLKFLLLTATTNIISLITRSNIYKIQKSNPNLKLYNIIILTTQIC